MAMTGEGLATLRRQYVDAVAAQQTNNEGTAVDYGWLILLADSQAIVDYIQANARCSGTDSSGDTHDSVQIV
ncbi:MAG: hypothetical protein AB7I29_07045 [Geobacter sp.]